MAILHTLRLYIVHCDIHGIVSFGIVIELHDIEEMERGEDRTLVFTKDNYTQES